MIFYHTIRAFLTTLVMLPFYLMAGIGVWIAYLFSFTEDIDLNQLNPFSAYKTVKKNMASGDFHKWTGRRIRG